MGFSQALNHPSMIFFTVFTLKRNTVTSNAGTSLNVVDLVDLNVSTDDEAIRVSPLSIVLLVGFSWL